MSLVHVEVFFSSFAKEIYVKLAFVTVVYKTHLPWLSLYLYNLNFDSPRHELSAQVVHTTHIFS